MMLKNVKTVLEGRVVIRKEQKRKPAAKPWSVTRAVSRHGYDVASSSGLVGMEMQGAMAIFAVNVKRIIKLINEKQHGFVPYSISIRQKK